jgi:Flavin containing amine oxidoreductase
MKPKASRICVVGAGAAGLSAAHYLLERGYKNVTVLEAAERIGGKCHSIDFQGRTFDLGANYVTAAYSEIRKLAKQYRAPLYTESPVTTARMLPSGKLAFHRPRATIIGRSTLLGFARAVIRYFRIRLLLRPIIDRPGFRDISKQRELCVSFQEWLTAHDLAALAPMFEIPITIMGYGYLDEIPAPYALKYLSLATYWNLVVASLDLPRSWPKRFVNGFERLWDALAHHIDIRRGVTITSIERNGTIEVRIEGATALEFDYLFLACPLDVHTLDRFLRLSDEEAGLFKRITNNKYVVTSYAIADLHLPQRIVGMWPIPEMGVPWAFTQQYADSQLVQFYTRLDRSGGTKATVIEGINRCVTALGATLPENYLTYDEWNFFPHVGIHDLRDGFYERMEMLQGQLNTYYCGGIAAFELVETVMQYSREVVKSHF